MDLFNVKDRTILITGASRGIGKAIALAFHAAGAKVYGTGTKESSISWMKEKDRMEGRVCNVSDPSGIQALMQEIKERDGRLDCLVNNAGVASNTPASGFKEDEMESIIDINFKGVFRASQAYYKMQRKAGGNIINVSSVLGMIGTPLASVYSGTKGAVLQLTRSLAIEWAGSGFRINAICPGFIDTDMTEMIKSRPDVLEKMTAEVPLRRLGNPEDLTGAAIFLASDASSYMTGQMIVVDGGFTTR